MPCFGTSSFNFIALRLPVENGLLVINVNDLEFTIVFHLKSIAELDFITKSIAVDVDDCCAWECCAAVI